MEAEERYRNGVNNLTDFIGSEPSKKRKRRTSFTPAALEVLNNFFEINTHPSGRFYLMYKLIYFNVLFDAVWDTDCELSLLTE